MSLATDRALGYASTGAGLGATIGSAIPVIGTGIGTAIGGIGGGLYGYFSGPDEDPYQAYQSPFTPGSVDSALLAAQNRNQGLYSRIQGSDAYQGLIGGGLDSIYDQVLGSPNFQAMLAGEVSPQYTDYLSRQLGQRFNTLRSDVGANLARRGLANTTIGARQINDTYNNERQALSDALAARSMQRQALGFDIANRAAGNRLSRLGLGYNMTQAIGANRQHMASQIANNRLARSGFGRDTMAMQNAQQAAIGQGVAGTVSGIAELYDAQRKLAAEQQQPIPGYLTGPTTPTRKPIGSIAGSGGSQPKSLMKSPGSGSPFLRSMDQLKRPSIVQNMNPTAGRSGFGQMSRL